MLAFALITAARRLRPYFQAHTIKVMTETPLAKVLRKLDGTGRLVGWSVELSEFDLIYEPRKAIKGQALADFLIELIGFPPEEAAPIMEKPWILYTDASSCRTGRGLGLYLVCPEGSEYYYKIPVMFTATNNEVEYEALVAGLEVAIALGAIEVEVKTDSQVVVNQVNGTYATKSEKLKLYLAKVQALRGTFSRFAVTHVPRAENKIADQLARAASGRDTTSLPWNVVEKIIEVPSIGVDVNVLSPNVPNWASGVAEYLYEGRLPDNKEEARKIRRKASRFQVVDGVLYRRGFSFPLLRCISHDEAQYVLAEIHEGVCGNHSGGRALAAKAVRAGYYWPNALRDAREYVKKCLECQKYAPVQHSPSEELTSIMAPWPFAQWGVDLVGPLPQGRGGVKFMIVAVDYFTKWAEAEPLAKITSKIITKFLWKNIICRFGVPYSLVTDNGGQFDSEYYRQWCEELKITVKYSSPGHPQANGQVEATNKTLLSILKKKVASLQQHWADELPGVLWAYRTSVKTPTGESPFALAYGCEAVAPVEIGLPTYRTRQFSQTQNDATLEENLDLIEELRDIAEAKTKLNKAKVERYFNKRVKSKSLKVGDLVLKKCGVTTPAEGKMGPRWEGPYLIIACNRPGSYRLKDSEGKELSHPWNVEHLKKFYQ